MISRIVKILLRNIIGFLLFMGILAIANMAAPAADNPLLTQVIHFMNNNIIVLLILCIVTIFTEIFWSFYFPLSVLAPLLSAVLSVLTINFIYRLWIVIDGFIHAGIGIPIGLLYRFVPILVVILGYLLIFIRMGRPKEYWEGHAQKRREHEAPASKGPKTDVEWNEVGREYRLFLYNLGRSLNSLFDNDGTIKEKTKKKKN